MRWWKHLSSEWNRHYIHDVFDVCDANRNYVKSLVFEVSTCGNWWRKHLTIWWRKSEHMLMQSDRSMFPQPIKMLKRCFERIEQDGVSLNFLPARNQLLLRDVTWIFPNFFSTFSKSFFKEPQFFRSCIKTLTLSKQAWVLSQWFPKT